MISHTFLGVHGFDRGLRFYRALFAAMGIAERFCDPARPWAGWRSDPGPRPLFLIGRPYDQQAHRPGNGHMIAMLATTREMVDQAYAVAIAAGATDDGKPGLRPEYHPHYYGAYFRDTEGNKLCVVCHIAPG